MRGLRARRTGWLLPLSTFRPIRPASLPWRLLISVCYVSVAVVTVGRGILGGFFPELYPNFQSGHPVNVVAQLTANVALVLTAVGVLVAWREEAEAKEREERAREAAARAKAEEEERLRAEAAAEAVAKAAARKADVLGTSRRQPPAPEKPAEPAPTAARPDRNADRNAPAAAPAA